MIDAIMKKQKVLAIVGVGRWGKNLLREFSKIAKVPFCHHQGNAKNLKWLKENFPKIKVVGSYLELLKNPKIDAIVIATPIATHYELTRKALMAGKDVFVEKPLSTKVNQAHKLVELSEKNGRILFVGHIFSYHPVLAKIRSIARKEPLKHASFVWNKLGTFNEDLVSNLASHDVATTLDLFGAPVKIETLENRGIVSDCDIKFIRLDFKQRKSCTIYINRVSNHKNKTVTLVTDKNIYLWENNKLLKLNPSKKEFKQIFQSIISPLEIECAEFIKCLETNKKPLTDGRFGLKVIEILSKI